MAHTDWGTPPPVVKAVLDMLEARGVLHNTNEVFEPSCGRGHFLLELRQRNYRKVEAVELNPDFAATAAQIYPVKTMSFFDCNQPVEIVLGNPPFNGDQGLHHLAHAKSLATRAIAFILPLGMLELCNNRGDFRKGLTAVLSMPRYPFIDLKTNIVANSGQRPNCLYVWERKKNEHWLEQDVQLDLNAFSTLHPKVLKWRKSLRIQGSKGVIAVP